MMTYDEFLTWAAEQHYKEWLNSFDFNGNEMPLGIFDAGVVSMAAAIYKRPEANVATSLRTRLDTMFHSF